MARDVPPPAVFLMGPTGAGKTQVALELAEHLPLEIVSVDSALIYRHMDIGTAKPDAATRARVRHHLVDLIDPDAIYSAARFRKDALAAMADITQRGKLPLLVGGTMLYFKTLLEGINDLPEADPGIRLVIDTMAQDAGWPALHEELARVDPETAERLNPNDAQRIQRALEVYYLTDTPLSALLKRPKRAGLPYRVLKIALLPEDRGLLHRRIAERFEEMLESGLLAEVRRLRADFALDLSSPAVRCVGYRQVWQYLDGNLSLAQLREAAQAATRQLARRQLTWLRAMEDVVAIPCEALDATEWVLQAIRRHLATA